MTAGPETLVEQVVATYRDCPDARLREVMESAVRHLHAFTTELRLTRAEWEAGIHYLTAVGQRSSDTRQEFILLSDTLGVSSLVEMLGFDADEAATQNTVLGPFYVEGSPLRENGSSIVVDDRGGTPLLVDGSVSAVDGTPLGGAEVDVWQTSPDGEYAGQDATQDPANLRGIFRTDTEGRFSFRTVRPVVYSIPDDGPVGELLRATGRHPMRAAHIHLIVRAPGYKTLTTHVFDAESGYLESDAVFGVRQSLVVRFAEAPAGDGLQARFDVVLDEEQ